MPSERCASVPVGQQLIRFLVDGLTFPDLNVGFCDRQLPDLERVVDVDPGFVVTSECRCCALLIAIERIAQTQREALRRA